MTYAPTTAMAKSPRSYGRPPLSGLATLFQALVYAGVGFAILAVVIAFIAEDPVGFMAAASLLGGALLCGIGWVVVYIARTLDDIGYAVGAPAGRLPLPPPHANP